MRLTVLTRLLLGGALLVAGCGVVLLLRSHHAPTANPLSARAALPHRVTVEVLNTTRAVGVARAVRDLVRRAGLDVVYFGGADTAQRGRTHNEVLVRRGDTTGVGRILEALGQGVVTDAPDRTREVDLTVLIGTDWPVPKPAPRP
jgi:hypothetical protein